MSYTQRPLCLGSDIITHSSADLTSPSRTLALVSTSRLVLPPSSFGKPYVMGNLYCWSSSNPDQPRRWRVQSGLRKRARGRESDVPHSESRASGDRNNTGLQPQEPHGRWRARSIDIIIVGLNGVVDKKKKTRK